MGRFLISLLGCVTTVASSMDDCLAQSVSLFGNTVPVTEAVKNNTPMTLGVKFWSNEAGTISAIRFYRGAVSPEGYVAGLYSASGTLLGEVTLAHESGPVPGWQTAVFAEAVPISANKTYVASYYTPSGQYADTTYGLKTGVAAGPLTATASASVGGNGVYHKGEGFPKSSSEASNYFVDVEFTSAVPTPYLRLSFNPGNPTIMNNAPLGSLVTTVTASWSNGSPFTGMLSFGSPDSNSNGTFALLGNNVIVNPAGPGVSADGGMTLDATIVATQ